MAESGRIKYGNIRGELQQVSSPGDFGSFLSRLNCAMFGSVLHALLICALMIVHIALIVVGVRNLGNCAVQSSIPVYLIASGALSTLLALKQLACIKNKEEQGGCLKLFDAAIGLAGFVFLILGSYWVYTVYDNVQFVDAKAATYCDHTAYMIAFVYITLYYAFFALMIFCCCCAVCVACFVSE